MQLISGQAQQWDKLRKERDIIGALQLTAQTVERSAEAVERRIELLEEELKKANRQLSGIWDAQGKLGPGLEGCFGVLAHSISSDLIGLKVLVAGPAENTTIISELRHVTQSLAALVSLVNNLPGARTPSGG